MGPTVHSPLNDVLIRFREHPYVLITDISKMYRAVGLDPNDRDFHRFLWRNNPDEEIQEYRMNRVTFGITSAPFLATKSILQLAEENQTSFPQAAKAVKEAFYVDDGLPSVKTQEEAIRLYQQLQQLFQKGAFKLHKWDSNSPEVLNAIPEEIRGIRLHRVYQNRTTLPRLLESTTIHDKTNSDSQSPTFPLKELNVPNV